MARIVDYLDIDQRIAHARLRYDFVMNEQIFDWLGEECVWKYRVTFYYKNKAQIQFYDPQGAFEFKFRFV